MGMFLAKFYWKVSFLVNWGLRNVEVYQQIIKLESPSQTESGVHREGVGIHEGHLSQLVYNF